MNLYPATQWHYFIHVSKSHSAGLVPHPSYLWCHYEACCLATFTFNEFKVFFLQKGIFSLLPINNQTTKPHSFGLVFWNIIEKTLSKSLKKRKKWFWYQFKRCSVLCQFTKLLFKSKELVLTSKAFFLLLLNNRLSNALFRQLT